MSRWTRRWAAASVPQRSSGSGQLCVPVISGPHQVVEPIDIAISAAVASRGNSRLVGHGTWAGTGSSSTVTAPLTAAWPEDVTAPLSRVT